MDLLIKKQECEAEIRLWVVERQADRDIQLRKMDLEAKHLAKKPVLLPRTRPTSVLSPVTPASSTVTEDFSRTPSNESFDISKYIRLVPPFRETDVDSYFVAFERIASKLGWPKDMWALLLQCSLTGKLRKFARLCQLKAVLTMIQLRLQYCEHMNWSPRPTDRSSVVIRKQSNKLMLSLYEKIVI